MAWVRICCGFVVGWFSRLWASRFDGMQASRFGGMCVVGLFAECLWFGLLPIGLGGLGLCWCRVWLPWVLNLVWGWYNIVS